MPALEQAATQIIALEPGSPDGYALRALSNINRQQFQRAEQDAAKAIEVAPQNAMGYLQMGNVHFAQKQFGDAAKFLQQALDHDPIPPTR